MNKKIEIISIDNITYLTIENCKCNFFTLKSGTNGPQYL